MAWERRCQAAVQHAQQLVPSAATCCAGALCMRKLPARPWQACLVGKHAAPAAQPPQPEVLQVFERAAGSHRMKVCFEQACRSLGRSHGNTARRANATAGQQQQAVGAASQHSGAPHPTCGRSSRSAGCQTQRWSSAHWSMPARQSRQTARMGEGWLAQQPPSCPLRPGLPPRQGRLRPGCTRWVGGAPGVYKGIHSSECTTRGS